MITLKIKRKDWNAIIYNTCKKSGKIMCAFFLTELEKKMNIEIVG